jgi:hypothetical protein
MRCGPRAACNTARRFAEGAAAQIQPLITRSIFKLIFAEPQATRRSRFELALEQTIIKQDTFGYQIRCLGFGANMTGRSSEERRRAPI